MASLPADHDERIARAVRSLSGLSVGDAFGQRFFYNAHKVEARIVDPPPWHYTDDTIMAISVFNVLKEHGCVKQDELAIAFAHRYTLEPNRGYGGTAHEILRSIEWNSVVHGRLTSV